MALGRLEFGRVFDDHGNALPRPAVLVEVLERGGVALALVLGRAVAAAKVDGFSGVPGN